MDAELRNKVLGEAAHLGEAARRMQSIDELHQDDDPTWFLTLARTIGDIRKTIEALEKELAVEAVTSQAAKAPEIAANLGRSKMVVYKWARADNA